VVITRAQTYGKAAQPSPLLALLDGAPPMPAMPAMQPLLPDDELRSLLDVATSLAHEADADDETDDDSAKGAQTHMGPSSADAAQKPTFHLRELEQYLACPLKYKYTRRYALLDPAEDAVHRFHSYIRRGASELRELHTSAPAAEWPAAAARLKALWETAGPAGHAYDAFYWQRAEEILRAEWKSITAPGEAAAQSQVLLAQPLQATLRRCTVEVTADRVVSGLALADTRSTPAPTLLVRLHTGRPHAADETQDLTLPLYYLAHQQQRPGVPVKIALAYVGDALADAEPGTDEPGTNEPSQSYLVDVTENARKVAEKYMQPDRKQRSALDKLDEAAAAILAGRFAARPEERRCAACAYCHICPADPDDERNVTAAAPVADRQIVGRLAPMAD
jgi:hypothetical protein